MSKIFVADKLKIQGKQTLSAIALILLLTATAFMASVPPAKASNNLPTHAFLSVSPNPTGVNQEVTALMWLIEINPTASGPQGSRWQNYKLQITKPDGTSLTLGPFTADPASFAYATFTPDQTGTYNLNFSFPGQHVVGIGTFIAPAPFDTYYGVSSVSATLTVQQQQVGTTPQTPLPTGYWTRSVNAQNQLWYAISGNWLGTAYSQWCQSYNGTGNYNPYTTAPDSAHILWTKPLTFGGLIGGEFGSSTTSNYYTGKAYEKTFTPPVIMNGVLYYNVPAPPREGFYAVDLRTGETLWRNNGTGTVTADGMTFGGMGYTGITLGQIFNYQSPNQIGGIPYLWTTSYGATFYMYDAFTGDLILSIANATKGYAVEGPNGELLMYYMGNNWLAMWNSTKCIGAAGGISTLEWEWRPVAGSTLDFQSGVQWNVTTDAYPGQSIQQINSGVILAITGNLFIPQNWEYEIGYSPDTGQQLWVQNRTTPIGQTEWV